jgi:hypothetical protein
VNRIDVVINSTSINSNQMTQIQPISNTNGIVSHGFTPQPVPAPRRSSLRDGLLLAQQLKEQQQQQLKQSDQLHSISEKQQEPQTNNSFDLQQKNAHNVLAPHQLSSQRQISAHSSPSVDVPLILGG